MNVWHWLFNRKNAPTTPLPPSYEVRFVVSIDGDQFVSTYHFNFVPLADVQYDLRVGNSHVSCELVKPITCHDGRWPLRDDRVSFTAYVRPILRSFASREVFEADPNWQPYPRTLRATA